MGKLRQPHNVRSVKILTIVTYKSLKTYGKPIGKVKLPHKPRGKKGGVSQSPGELLL